MNRPNMFIGRKTFLVPVTWVDGWPVFNNNQSITEIGPGPTNVSRPKLWIDDFNSRGRNSALSIGWYTVRTAYKTQYGLGARSGYLHTYGNFINLTELASPAVYLRKQTDFNAKRGPLFGSRKTIIKLSGFGAAIAILQTFVSLRERTREVVST